VLEGAMRLDVAESSEDVEVQKRCAAAAAASLRAFFQLVGDGRTLPNVARADLEPRTQLAREALHFARDHWAVPMGEAVTLVAAAANHVGLKLPKLAQVATAVEGELAMWKGDGLRQVEAQVSSERAAAAHTQALHEAERQERIAPALITTTPRERGALITRRDIGERERAMMLDDARALRAPLSFETIRDGVEWQVFAFPVFHAIVDMPPGFSVEEQIGPDRFRVRQIVPADEPVLLAQRDLDTGARVLAPSEYVAQLRKRLQALDPRTQDVIDRSRIRDARGGMLATMALRREVRALIARCEPVFKLTSGNPSDYWGPLHQAIVRGLLVDPLIAAAELGRTAKKIDGVSPVAKAWASDLFGLADAGERYLQGGIACIVAPGALIKGGE
jgi:hypothetical protein